MGPSPVIRHVSLLSPNQAEAQYNLASALLRMGRTDEAIAHYQKVLELQADNADAYANLGSAFLAKGHVRDAIAAYRNAIRISPENVAAQSNLAWLLATSQTRRSEMDQRLSIWLNRPTRKALEARITRLFCASWLRHTPRVAVLVRPNKLLNRHCKRLRSKETLLWPTPFAMKSRCTI